MLVVGERVLHVELELVDLPLRQHIDEPVQRRHRRHFVAADVQHDAAIREVWMVFDVQLWQPFPELPHQLRQRREPVRQPGAVARHDADPLIADRQVVPLALRDLVVDARDDALALRQPRRGAHVPSYARIRLDRIAQPARLQPRQRSRLAKQHNRPVAGQRMPAAGNVNRLRNRSKQKFHAEMVSRAHESSERWKRGRFSSI